jgi:hypothetical protein
VDIRANLEEYLRDRRATERYASFDYCFNYFQEQSDGGLAAELASDANLETSCLQLGFYLASWGMYRGSTDLLKHSVAYLTPVIRAIAESPLEIWSIDSNGYSDANCSLILDVSKRIRTASLMLGVFGSVPAFDTYFKRGSGLWTFNRSALSRLAKFYVGNSELIERYRVHTLDFATGSETTRLYSRAKVIDMIFFVEGARQPLAE